MTKKEQILQETLQLIVSKGIHATPMSEIAKAAHTGMGTIYNYFPTKEVLLNELYFHLKRKEAQLIMEGYDATKPVKQRFVYLWKKMMQYFLQEPLDFMFLEQFYYSPTINPDAKHQGSLHLEVLDQVYTDGQALEIIKPGAIRKWIGFTSGSLLALVKLHHSQYIIIAEQDIDFFIQSAWDGCKA